MENQQEEIAKTLKNMVGNHDLAIDFTKDISADFFAWQKDLVKINSISNHNNYAMEATMLELDKDEFSIISNRQNNLKNCRFSADMAFCYLKFHDFINVNNFDLNRNQHEIFEEFEKLRLLIKASESYIGVAKNILDIIERNILSYNKNSPALLFLTKNNNLQDIIKIYSGINDLKEELSKKFNPNIIAQIDEINKNIDSNEIFFGLVYKLILLLDNNEEKKSQDQNNNKSLSDNKNNLIGENIENIDQESTQIEDDKHNEIENKTIENPNVDDKKINIFSSQESLLNQDLIDQNICDSSKIAFKKPYKIYTDKFDEIIFPNKLIKKEELKNLRNQLDLKMNKLQSISKKMRMKLKKKLLSKRDLFLEYDSSRGVIDRKKLSRLVINSNIQDIWVNNKSHQYQDTALTILLDNSGSMRGNPIIMSALACEIIADILQNFAVKIEIIGFTTGDWKGGRVKKLWEISGRPSDPGRLNELRHIVYKHFNQNFKKARMNLGLMLKEGILKENIDGEALLFAKSRLMQQAEKRKILLVISDGNPVDDSTNSSNSEDILSLHLHHVINNIEKKSKIEVVGIGIGHSTKEFYRNSIAIKNLEELGDVMIEKIAYLL